MMNLYTQNLYMCFVLQAAITVETSLTAVNHRRHVIQLYQKLQNENPPHNADLAARHTSTRKCICKDITNSGFFHFVNLFPIEEEDIRRQLRCHPVHSPFLRRIYCYNCPLHYFAYTFPHQKRKSNVAEGPLLIDEYVFACPLKNLNGGIGTYFVTKEYNVAPTPLPYLPGRFIFLNYSEAGELNYLHSHMLLVEEPAIAYTGEPDFNLELCYLRVRERVHPAESNDSDPLCKLVSENSRDLDNQHYHLCMAMLRSTRFKNEFTHPGRASARCREEKISFRTPEAIEKAAELPHGSYERMTLCHSEFDDPSEDASSSSASYIFISRAYESNEVLVFRLDTVDDKIYLDNVSSNISIVDEVYLFTFPED